MRRILPRVACGGDDPAAHIYPFDDLHITVVTFSTTIDVPVDEVYTEDRKKYCVGIVESRKRYGWEVRMQSLCGKSQRDPYNQCDVVWRRQSRKGQMRYHVCSPHFKADLICKIASCINQYFLADTS